MKSLSSSDIRKMWLDFFASKGHYIEQSASLVPHDDPTLLWTNAGVTPLKKYFDGSVIPENPRITNAQKCIRTNDIENVGKTARHHTFFEMLGNFSIGDYFKKEAISWAVELLFDKKWFDFPKEKIYITYYYKDNEARDEWIKNGISVDHLIPLESNFWEIGEGPCGPDTEMFFDRGEKYDIRGKELIEKDIENDRFIEIWNIVFSQYNSKAGVKREDYKELPSKNIDTGCGLERVACVMQNVDTNYETDLFMPIIKKIEEISKVKYEGQMAFKVIADHIRTVTFAISDGATLSNEGRGYVLRRVLRRATKHAKSLGINYPFMGQLVDVVVDIMKSFYPYLVGKKEIVKQIVTKEEEKFLSTISNGEKKFENILLNSKNVISGYDAFILYDTYGFPFELTKEYAEERGFTVNEEEFNKAMLEQKERARSARKEVNSMKSQNEEYMHFKAESIFVGYENLCTKSKVIKVFGNGVVLDKTPFYAFSGGQLPDKGVIDGEEVINVEKMPNGQHLHILLENNFKEGQTVEAIVDKEYRDRTCKNHSCCHLLQKSLQTVLGDYVHQQGSQVCADYVRFDFNSYNSLSDVELLKVENLVNDYIKESYSVNTNVLPLEEAKKIGAMALFGEKYGKLVRVVDMNVSKEFCGGTHVANTGDINTFYITDYSSIGSGIFRIQGVTGENADELFLSSMTNLDIKLSELVSKAKSIINQASLEHINLDFNFTTKVNKKYGYNYILGLRSKILECSLKIRDLEKEYQNKKSQKALKGLSEYDHLIKNSRLITKVWNVEPSLLKEMAKTILNNKQLKLVVLASCDSSKVTFVAASNSYDCGMIVKEAVKITGGGGGGKKDLAQAGGKDPSKVDEALKHVEEIVE